MYLFSLLFTLHTYTRNIYKGHNTVHMSDIHYMSPLRKQWTLQIFLTYKTFTWLTSFTLRVYWQSISYLYMYVYDLHQCYTCTYNSIILHWWWTHTWRPTSTLPIAHLYHHSGLCSCLSPRHMLLTPSHCFCWDKCVAWQPWLTLNEA